MQVNDKKIKITNKIRIILLYEMNKNLQTHTRTLYPIYSLYYIRWKQIKMETTDKTFENGYYVLCSFHSTSPSSARPGSLRPRASVHYGQLAVLMPLCCCTLQPGTAERLLSAFDLRAFNPLSSAVRF